jgi:hypothetical protein
MDVLGGDVTARRRRTMGMGAGDILFVSIQWGRDYAMMVVICSVTECYEL